MESSWCPYQEKLNLWNNGKLWQVNHLLFLKFEGNATERWVVLAPLRHIAGPLFLVMVVGPRMVKAIKPD